MSLFAVARLSIRRPLLDSVSEHGNDGLCLCVRVSCAMQSSSVCRSGIGAEKTTEDVSREAPTERTACGRADRGLLVKSKTKAKRKAGRTLAQQQQHRVRCYYTSCLIILTACLGAAEVKLFSGESSCTQAEGMIAKLIHAIFLPDFFPFCLLQHLN